MSFNQKYNAFMSTTKPRTTVSRELENIDVYNSNKKIKQICSHLKEQNKLKLDCKVFNT